MKLTKRLFAALAASVALFALAGCGTTSSSNSTSTPKDYTQIIHNARPDEENESMLILSTDGKGGFTATDGYSADMTAEDCKSQADNFILPMLGLAEGDYESFAASVSLMNVRSYAVAIVKPAAGKTDAGRPWRTTSPASRCRCRTTWPTSTRSPRPPRLPPSPRGKWCWCAVKTPTPC